VFYYQICKHFNSGRLAYRHPLCMKLVEGIVKSEEGASTWPLWREVVQTLARE